MNKVVIFTQSFCQPCKQLKPHLATACEKLDIELEEWDVEHNWDLAEEFNVLSTPTVIVMDYRNNAIKYINGRTVVSLLKELEPYANNM